MCSSTFSRFSIGGALALFAATLAAAPAVILEKARLVPSDGAPEGGFGRAIAIGGNVAVITANSQPRAYGAGPDQPGAAYVFERDSAGDWRQTAKLTSGREGDLYGLDVAVDGNVIVVGAFFAGSAHVYEKQNGAWQAVAVLSRVTGGGNGYSVAVKGNLIGISHLSSNGMAVYRRESSGWVLAGNYDNGLGLSDDDYYGPQVDISQNFAIHGSWGSDNYDPPVPSTAYVYSPSGGTNWAQPIVTPITQPGGARPNGFSDTVTISATMALISNYVFERDSAGQWNDLGYVLTPAALDDDEVTLLGLPRPFRHATLSRRSATSVWPWPLRAELSTSDAGEINSVATNHGRALFGSYPNNFAYVYEVPANLDRPNLAQDDFQDGDAIGWATTPGSLFAVASSGTFRKAIITTSRCEVATCSTSESWSMAAYKHWRESRSRSRPT